MATTPTTTFTGRVLTSTRDPNAYKDVDGEYTIMYPASASDLAVALKLCKDHDRDVIIRSGRNAVSTDKVNGEGAVVINMDALSDIHIEGNRVTVGAAATMQHFATVLYRNKLFLPFRDTLIKTVAAGVLSTQSGMLTRSAGLITSYLQQIHVVKKDGTPVVAQRGDDLFNAVLAKVDHSVISTLVFDALPEEQAQKFWMSFFYIPYREDTFKKLIATAFEEGKLPSDVDLAVKITLSSYGIPLVRVSTAGKDGTSKRETVLRHVEYVVSEANLGEIGFEIPHANFTGTEIVKAILDGGDTGAFAHGNIATKHTRLVSASRFPEFVDHYCKVLDAADGVADDGVMFLPNVSMMSHVLLTPDDNMSVTAYLFVPPGGRSRHTDEQEKLNEFKRYLNHIIPLEVSPPARRSLHQAMVSVAVPSFLAEDDLAISEKFNARSLGSLFRDDPLKLALWRAEPRIPGFKGEIFMQGDTQYTEKAHQYATTSKPAAEMSPFMVTFPEDVRDIQAAIVYGKRENKNIVARSGGHQYSGLSSGGHDTIVLSMDHFQTLSTRQGNLATVGVGSRLTDIAAFFKQEGITIPHGECPLVAMGGHCQTGGYGHLLRGFGLALDYVHSFNIVLADGEFVSVHRPTGAIDWKTDEVSKNDKIFWAVLGGGPNSFGIVTEITYEAIDDDSHPHSRGHMSFSLFQKDPLEAILKEVQKWTIEISKGQSDYLPEDLDLTASAISSDFRIGRIGWLSGFLLLEMVYGNYRGGSESESNVEKAQRLMTKIFDEVNDEQSILNKRRVEIDASVHTALSYLSDSFVRRTGTTPDGREFKYPYEKRLNATKQSLSDGFVEKFAELVDDSIHDDDVRVVFQMVIGGGKYVENGERGITSCSRRDVLFQVVYDVFYTEGEKDKALKYQERMKDLLESEFVEGEGLRLIWGSYGDTNMDNVWSNYYDDGTLYERLQSVKEDVDPDDVFHTRFTVQLPSV